MVEALKVDVWSDIACPWCYLGKRRFAAGAELYRASGGTHDVEVEFHSFQLSPTTPDEFEGTEVDYLVEHKGVPATQARQMIDQVTQVAAAEGLAYDFDSLRPANTRRAHQLLHLARVAGRQDEMTERLFSAHFVEGRHVGRIEELAALAGEVGLDPAEVRAALEAGSHDDAVQADIDQAHAYGISGVPFFVIDGRYGISGAQSPAMFARALAQAAVDAEALAAADTSRAGVTA